MVKLNRRQALLTGAGAVVGTMGLAKPFISRAHAADELIFSVWGGEAEMAGYNDAIEKFKAINPNVSIRLENVPFKQFYQQIDARLAGKQAPDIFRVQYQLVGRYAKSKAILDFSDQVPGDLADQFSPTHWQAATFEGKPFALPHHTDTFALFYNKDRMAEIGVTPPSSLDTSWTWDEFIEVARALRENTDVPYPFAMHFFGLAYRWMMYLHQAGGAVLDETLTKPVLDSDEGIKAIAWTQNWYKEGLVPLGTSIKGTEISANLFANGTIAMMLNGNWQIPWLSKNAKDQNWGVTYMPRDVNMASDLGGTCVTVSRDAKNPEAAAQFCSFLTNEENMRKYVVDALFLPVRKTLMADELQFSLRKPEMKIFVDQATTVPQHTVRTITLPTWSRMNKHMVDELDLAFTQNQSPQDTAKKIDAHIARVLKRG